MTCRYKLYTLAKGYNRNLTQQDVQMMACSTLLAALAIQPYDATAVGLSEEAQAQDADRRLRMATILGFTVVSLACPVLQPALHQSYPMHRSSTSLTASFDTRAPTDTDMVW